MKSRFAAAALFLACLPFASVSHAGSWGTSGYTGLGFIDEGQFDDSSFSGSTSLVYFIGQSWGIEGGYTSFGDFKSDFDAAGGRGRAEAGIDGFTLGLNFLSNLDDDWYLSGRVGAWSWDSEVKLSAPGLPQIDADGDGTDIYAGIGAGWRYSERFGIGLGVTYYGVDVGNGANNADTGVYIIGVNTNYRF